VSLAHFNQHWEKIYILVKPATTKKHLFFD